MDEEARELKRRAAAGDLEAALALETVNDETFGRRTRSNSEAPEAVVTDLGTVWVTPTKGGILVKTGRDEGVDVIEMLGRRISGSIEFRLSRDGPVLKKAYLYTVDRQRFLNGLSQPELERIEVLLKAVLTPALELWARRRRTALEQADATSLHNRIVELKESVARYEKALEAKKIELAKALVTETKLGGRRR